MKFVTRPRFDSVTDWIADSWHTLQVVTAENADSDTLEIEFTVLAHDLHRAFQIADEDNITISIMVYSPQGLDADLVIIRANGAPRTVRDFCQEIVCGDGDLALIAPGRMIDYDIWLAFFDS